MERAPAASRAWSPAALVLAGHAALAAALFVSDGFDQIPALILVLVALGAWMAAMIAVARGAERGAEGMDRWAWGGALATALLAFVRDPIQNLEGPILPYRLASLVVLALVASYALDVLGLARVPRGVAIARRAALFVAAIVIGRWVFHASPHPAIDLFPLHQQAAQTMLAGKSIYEPGNIDTVVTYVGQNHAPIDEYTYLPLGAIWTTIAYAISGDIRWANFAGVLIGTGLVWIAARRSLARAGDARAAVWADLIAVMILFHPRGWRVLELAWTEPMSLPFLAGFVVAALARKRWIAIACLGLLMAGKQHMVLYGPFLMMVPGIGLGGAILAGVVALATIVPFAVASPHGLLRGIWLLHKNGPFRGDSLSITGELSSLYVLPTWVGFVAAMVPFAWIPRLPRRIAPLLLGACLTFMLFYVFGRQAFLNYYWLLDVTALLVLATLGEPRESSAA